MKARRVFCLLLVGTLLSFAGSSLGQEHAHKAGAPEKLGEVRFPISCDPVVREPFSRAVAMLHSFWYQEAAKAFAPIAQQDANCGMAYWGLAMTYYHPLWPDRPDAATLKEGWAAVEKAKAAGAKTPRERDYITAIEVFYKDAEKLDHPTRVRAYEKAMEQLSQRYPADSEAAILYALSILGTAYSSPADKSYTKHQQAGAILEKLFAQQPEHPGLAHYIIHSYDFPPLAGRALTAARRYAKIAPDAPHALHMPSHIFTRLGLWPESIASNLSSAAAANKYNWTGEELHAMDYLVYAYLQGAQDQEARKILNQVPPITDPMPSYFAGLYATAAIPARYMLERRQWSEAAALKLAPDTFRAGRYSWAEATIRFARGLGAARTGDVAKARDEVQRLEVLKEVLLQEKENYWAEQVEVQRRAVAAWLALDEGRKTEALTLMRSAADLEDSMDKSPVTPGAVIPARELLGDMLLELKQPGQAVGEFEAALRASPNRFNSLYGAGRAAELVGEGEKAKNFYAKLVAICDHADTERAELRTAQGFLNSPRR